MSDIAIRVATPGQHHRHGQARSEVRRTEMVKTALDLTASELRTYRPGGKPTGQQVPERWERAWEVARIAARVLREQFGAARVVAFGSLAHRAWFGPWSDIDLAAWGLPPDRFYGAVAAVTGLSPDFEIDLVDPEGCRPAVRRSIEREGIAL